MDKFESGDFNIPEKTAPVNLDRILAALESDPESPMDQLRAQAAALAIDSCMESGGSDSITDMRSANMASMDRQPNYREIDARNEMSLASDCGVDAVEEVHDTRLDDESDKSDKDYTARTVETGKLLPPIQATFDEAVAFIEPANPDEDIEAEWNRLDVLQEDELDIFIEDKLKENKSAVRKVKLKLPDGNKRFDDEWSLQHQFPSGDGIQVAFGVNGDTGLLTIRVAHTEPAEKPGENKVLAMHEYGARWGDGGFRTDFFPGNRLLSAMTLKKTGGVKIDYSQLPEGFFNFFGPYEREDAFKSAISFKEFEQLKALVTKLELLQNQGSAVIDEAMEK